MHTVNINVKLLNSYVNIPMFFDSAEHLRVALSGSWCGIDETGRVAGSPSEMTRIRFAQDKHFRPFQQMIGMPAFNKRRFATSIGDFRSSAFFGITTPALTISKVDPTDTISQTTETSGFSHLVSAISNMFKRALAV